MINFNQGGKMQNAMTPIRWLQLPADYKKQLDNWVHWTRRDLGSPDGFRSNMPTYQSNKDSSGDDTMPVDPIIYVFNQDAEKFDILLNGLSKDHLHIFKIHYIDRICFKTGQHAARGGYVPRHMMDKKYKVLEIFKILTISRSTYDRRVKEIEVDIKRRGKLA